MTVTSLPQGSPTPRRSLTRRLLATLAAGAVTLSLLAPAAAASAAPTPSPTATMAAEEPSLAVAPASGGILRPSESLVATATVRNPGPGSAPSSAVSLLLSTAPLPDRAALERWLAGDAAGVDLQPIAAGSLDATASGAQTSVTLTVPATDPALAGRAPGVYPLQARSAGLTAATVVVIPDGAAAPAPIGLVVPITASPLERGLLTASELADLTAVDGPLTAQLDAVEGTEATLAVDPAIPAAIRVLGTSAPPTAVAWVERLVDLPNARFALQYGDADLAAQLQAGLPGPLAPASLQTYMAAADFTSPAPAVTAVSTPSPSPTADAGEPVFPDLGTLLDIGPATENVFWPATGTAGPGLVAALASTASADAPARVLLPSTSAGERTVAANASVSGVSTPVYDAGISAALTRAAAENDVTRRGAALAGAVGLLTFARADAGGQPVLAAIDRGTDRSRASLRATVLAATTAPGYEAATLDEVAAVPASPVSIGEPAPDTARVDEVTQLVADEAIIDRFATVLDRPELLTGRERAEMLQILNVSWTGDAARQAVSAHREATRQTLDSVGILSSDFRLVSSSAPLRPWIRNDLPWPITVVLVSRPDDVRLRVQERTEVEAQASANTRVEVPVEARIANGDVSVALQLYSPTGEPIGAPQGVDVEVRAEWETIGLIVIIGLVVVFIGIGVARTIARRRGTRVSADATTGDASDDGNDPRGERDQGGLPSGEERP